MFRRLANAFSTSSDRNISSLTDMGFSAEESRHALQSTDGDVTQAANLLLASSTTPTRPTNTFSNNDNIDSDLQRALKESLDIQQNSTKKTNQKLPPKLKDKSHEEQISRCVSRLQPFPRAVDTLIIALTKIRDNPADQKYRSIDTSAQGYKETLLNVPGAQDLLTCCRFQKQGQYLKLDRFHIDLALLWLAISSLQNATNSEEYRKGKQLINFHKTLQSMLTNNTNYSKQLSSEPDSTQNSSLIHVQFTDTITHKRRFHPDDTLQDIITWIGLLSSNQISNKIISNEYILVDKNFAPPKVIPTSSVMLRKTLQSLGFWPSAKLQILMKEMVDCDDDIHFGNERGLGVAL